MINVVYSMCVLNSALNVVFSMCVLNSVLTLRRLERDGYISRHVEPTIPPSVTYELSDLGRSFSAQVASLVEWSKQHKTDLEIARTAFDENHA